MQLTGLHVQNLMRDLTTEIKMTTPVNAPLVMPRPQTPENAHLLLHHSVRKWPEPPPLTGQQAAIQRAKQECLAWEASVLYSNERFYSHKRYLSNLAHWKAAQERLDALCPPVLTYTCAPSPAIARRLRENAYRAVLEKA